MISNMRSKLVERILSKLQANKVTGTLYFSIFKMEIPRGTENIASTLNSCV